MEKPAMFYRLARSEDLSAQALHDVMSRIVAEAAQRHLRADQPPVPGVRRHGRVRICQANLLIAAGLLAIPLDPPLGFLSRTVSPDRIRTVVILRQHCLHVPLAQALPSHVRTDQRGVNVHNFTLSNPSCDACAYCANKNCPEQLCSPALADAGQRRMIWQRLVQAVTCEPPNGEVDLRFAHELTIMDNAEEKASQHKPHRGLRVDTRPADAVTGIALTHLAT